MKRSSFILVLILSVCSIRAQQSLPALSSYLETHRMSPEAYVISKFSDHDYVFIGEYHRIQHDVKLVAALIPLLYKNHIYNLGIEFGLYSQQQQIDSMMAAPAFNRKWIDSLYFNYYPFWGYKEYIDLYEIAWKLNHSRHADTNKFRVINLGCLYNPCTRDHFGGFDPDVYMARVILKELVAKKKKALIYSGCHHAFTRYHQPLVDMKKDTVFGYTNTRMGNVVYDSIKDRTFMIYLHAGWPSAKGWDEPFVRPANGMIDSVMKGSRDQRAGFDVAGSPFGKLPSTDSYYAMGYPGFTLDMFCDGYIYQGPFKNYKPITMEKHFITDKNIDDLKSYMKCLKLPDNYIDTVTVKNANTLLMEDIRNHFRHLMK